MTGEEKNAPGRRKSNLNTNRQRSCMIAVAARHTSQIDRMLSMLRHLNKGHIVNCSVDEHNRA